MTTVENVPAVLPGNLYQDNTHLIAGRWVPAVEGGTIDVINPATGDLLARVPRGTAADVDAAVQAAQAAFPAWRDTSPAVRAQLLRDWAVLIAEHAADIDLLESMDVGRPSWGPSRLAAALEKTASLVDKVHGKSLPTHAPTTLAVTVREPYGVVGAVIPWNAPAPMFLNDIAPAIGAGNTIVLKPAEDAPLAPLALARLAEDAGIPAGVINVVTGYGVEAGAAIPEHPGVKRMSFTGSPATGRVVMAACAKNLTPLHLELGGKSPQVVFADADLDKAVPAIVRSITMNTGQICAAGSRVVVERSIQAELVERVAAGFRAVTVGRWDEPVEMGPLVNGRQLQRVRDYIKVGQEEGAKLVLGGTEPPAGVDAEHGFFVTPTLFDEVTAGMRIAQEEIFGPVLAVIPVDSEAEAIEVANGTEYGLAASVWTRDLGRAIRVAKSIEAGQVHVNTSGSFGVIGAPFGGYKSSGFGRTMGTDAVEDYTQVKTISIDASPEAGA